MHRGQSMRLAIMSIGLFTMVGCNADRAIESVSGVSPFGVPPRSSRTVVPLDPDSPFGIDFNGNHIYDNATTKSQAAQMMAQAGVRFARIAVYWNYMEQGQSNGLTPWEQAKLDTTVNALISVGIEPYITLEGTACFAISKAFSDSTCTWTAIHHTPDSEAHWQAWPAYVQEMVQAYPQVHYWGIWNEPNSDFLIPWTGDRLTAYKRLVEAASPIIRAAGGKVIAPDLGDGVDSLNISPTDAPTWLANFMAADGSLVDIVAVHYYGGSGSQSYVQTMGNFANAAGGKDVWLTEVAPGNWESGVADADQAWNLAAVYRAMLSWQVPKWKKTFYFTAGEFDAPANSGIVHDLGLTSQTPRPAYDSLKSIASVLPTSLNGPEFLYGQPQTYTWNAVASGGTSPYTFVWEVDDTEPYGDSWQSIPAADGANSLSLFVDGCDGQFALRVRVHDSDPWQQRWGSSMIVVENFLQEGSPGCIGNQKPW